MAVKLIFAYYKDCLQMKICLQPRCTGHLLDIQFTQRRSRVKVFWRWEAVEACSKTFIGFVQ